MKPRLKDACLTLSILVIPLFAMFCLVESGQCRIQESHWSDKNGADRVEFIYWMYKYKTHRTRGVCATMYSGDNSWVVEIPKPKSPTAIYLFDDKKDATFWAEINCPTKW